MKKSHQLREALIATATSRIEALSTALSKMKEGSFTILATRARLTENVRDP